MGALARILSVALALSTASAASAQCVGSCTTGVAYAPGQGSPNSVMLQLPVTASVRPACSFLNAPSGSHHEPDFDNHAWSHDFSFTIDCSVASRIAVVSTNGALKAPGTVPAGYTTQAPYDVTLNVVQNSGFATATCAAADLIAGGSCTFRGPAAIGQGLAVNVSQNQPGSYLRVSAPVYAGANVLASGTYEDILVVTLSPAS